MIFMRLLMDALVSKMVFNLTRELPPPYSTGVHIATSAAAFF
jgi:hypothetical protein